MQHTSSIADSILIPHLHAHLCTVCMHAYILTPSNWPDNHHHHIAPWECRFPWVHILFVVAVGAPGLCVILKFPIILDCKSVYMTASSCQRWCPLHLKVDSHHCQPTAGCRLLLVLHGEALPSLGRGQGGPGTLQTGMDFLIAVSFSPSSVLAVTNIHASLLFFQLTVCFPNSLFHSHFLLNSSD